MKRRGSSRGLIAALILIAVVGAVWMTRDGQVPETAPEASSPASSPASSSRPSSVAPGNRGAGTPGPGAAEPLPPPDAAEASDAAAGPGASAVARDFWRATDYLAYVDRHLDAALAGDAEAAYFVAMAQQACVPAVGRPTLSGKTEAIDAWLARRPELSDEQAASYRRRLHRCAGFAETYTSEADAEVLAEAADGLLRAAADAGHPAAIVESRMWVADGWRDGPGRDAVLDQLAGAAASGHPEALRKLGEYLGGDAGVTLTVLACEAGYDCGADADWVVEYCQFGWAVCGIEADGPEALLGSLPGYRAREVRERVATLRGGSAAAFRPFLDAALGPAAAEDRPP